VTDSAIISTPEASDEDLGDLLPPDGRRIQSLSAEVRYTIGNKVFVVFKK
jgi:hypothetical protein